MFVIVATAMVLIPTTGNFISKISATTDDAAQQEKDVAAQDELRDAGSHVIKNAGPNNDTDIIIECSENIKGLIADCG